MSNDASNASHPSDDEKIEAFLTPADDVFKDVASVCNFITDVSNKLSVFDDGWKNFVEAFGRLKFTRSGDLVAHLERLVIFAKKDVKQSSSFNLKWKCGEKVEGMRVCGGTAFYVLWHSIVFEIGGVIVEECSPSFGAFYEKFETVEERLRMCTEILTNKILVVVATVTRLVWSGDEVSELLAQASREITFVEAHLRSLSTEDLERQTRTARDTERVEPGEQRTVSDFAETKRSDEQEEQDRKIITVLSSKGHEVEIEEVPDPDLSDANIVEVPLFASQILNQQDAWRRFIMIVAREAFPDLRADLCKSIEDLCRLQRSPKSAELPAQLSPAESEANARIRRELGIDFPYDPSNWRAAVNLKLHLAITANETFNDDLANLIGTALKLEMARRDSEARANTKKQTRANSSVSPKRTTTKNQDRDAAWLKMSESGMSNKEIATAHNAKHRNAPVRAETVQKAVKRFREKSDMSG